MVILFTIQPPESVKIHGKRGRGEALIKLND